MSVYAFFNRSAVSQLHLGGEGGCAPGRLPHFRYKLTDSGNKHKPTMKNKRFFDMVTEMHNIIILRVGSRLPFDELGDVVVAAGSKALAICHSRMRLYTPHYTYIIPQFFLLDPLKSR